MQENALILTETKRNEFIEKLNTMIHRNNNQENRLMRYRNAKPILAYKIAFSGKNFPKTVMEHVYVRVK